MVKVIYFEGIDASGKGTQMLRAKEFLKGLGYNVYSYRQPGGTDFGRKIRDTILNSSTEIKEELTKCYLFAADRAELNSEIVRLHKYTDDILLCDRSILSSYVYQDDLGLDRVIEINHDAEFILRGISKMTIVNSISGEEAYRRMTERGELDNIEKSLTPEILDKMNNKYMEYRYRVDNSRLVESTNDPDENEKAIRNLLKEFLNIK